MRCYNGPRRTGTRSASFASIRRSPGDHWIGYERLADHGLGPQLLTIIHSAPSAPWSSLMSCQSRALGQRNGADSDLLHTYHRQPLCWLSAINAAPGHCQQMTPQSVRPYSYRIQSFTQFEAIQSSHTLIERQSPSHNETRSCDYRVGADGPHGGINPETLFRAIYRYVFCSSQSIAGT
jgi:hypothetical protein